MEGTQLVEWGEISGAKSNLNDTVQSRYELGMSQEESTISSDNPRDPMRYLTNIGMNFSPYLLFGVPYGVHCLTL